MLTGVVGKVGVLLALVETVLLLLLLDLGVGVGLLVTVLVKGAVTDVGVSRHVDVVWCGGVKRVVKKWLF